MKRGGIEWGEETMDYLRTSHIAPEPSELVKHSDDDHVLSVQLPWLRFAYCCSQHSLLSKHNESLPQQWVTSASGSHGVSTSFSVPSGL